MATTESLPATSQAEKTRSFILGKFWDPDKTMDAVKQLHGNGVRIDDVYSPFPLHGIEPFLGLKRSRLTTAAFIYGALGFLSGIAMMYYMFGIDWPMNIGGKPFVPWVDFVPITFEMTVLFAAHGMVITFFIVANYWPGKEAKLMDIRQTDDVFVIAIDKEDIENAVEIESILQSNGAYEVTEKDV